MSDKPDKGHVDPVIARVLANLARQRMKREQEAEARGDGAKVAELRKRFGLESQQEGN